MAHTIGATSSTVVTPLLADILFILAGWAALIFTVSCVQLVRLRLRVPDLGWSYQRLEFMATAFLATLRVVFFVLTGINRTGLGGSQRSYILTILDDVPNIGVLATFSFIVLYWADMLKRALSAESEATSVKIIFAMVNIVLVSAQVTLWILLILTDSWDLDIDHVDAGLGITACLIGVFLFVSTSYRLIDRLNGAGMPDSPQKANTLFDIRALTTVAVCSFCVRAGLLSYTFADADVVDSVWYVIVFYSCGELLPLSLFLFLLRKLPAPREAGARAKLLTSASVRVRFSKPGHGYSQINPTP